LAASDPSRVAIIGFCWGGRIGYIAACRMAVRAVVAYYGGGIPGCLGERPLCPIQFHFGEQDAAIPLSDVDQIRAALPDAPIHLYPAGHAFNNSDRTLYEPDSAALSLSRSLTFLSLHLN
jgi:carboxymethylenebutenolidase